jgi:transcriptional regulator with XRE-family HTH domain
MIREAEIGQRIKELRTGKALTLEELATTTGFSKDYLSKIENGKKALVICVSLQISFLTPLFAYSIFYLSGIAPDISTGDIYRGVFPFVRIQILVVLLCISFPKLVLWIPQLRYGTP